MFQLVFKLFPALVIFHTRPRQRVWLREVRREGAGVPAGVWLVTRDQVEDNLLTEGGDGGSKRNTPLTAHQQTQQRLNLQLCTSEFSRSSGCTDPHPAGPGPSGGQ